MSRRKIVLYVPILAVVPDDSHLSIIILSLRLQDAALQSALRERPNRITDGALFDAAHALGKYEITLDSPEILDLYDQESNRHRSHGNVKDKRTNATSPDNTVDGELALHTNNEQPALREGWETRILRHHDKIIRAKNNANAIISMGKVASNSTPGGMPDMPKSITRHAVPPPTLISALRQIFGSVSSHNVQDLLENMGEFSDIPEGDNFGKMPDNTLPSLMYTVLNHHVFVGNASTSIHATLRAPTASDDNKCIHYKGTSSGDSRKPLDSKREKRKILRHVRDGRDELGDDEDEIVGAGLLEIHHSRDSSAATSVGGGEKDDGRDNNIDLQSSGTENTCYAGETPSLAKAKELCVPSAANLESILGNACRDMLHRCGTQNSRMHGLLIAALSIMTECLFDHEELESMNVRGVPDGPISTTTTATPRFLDSSNTADPFAPLLQVGTLLFSFPTSDEITDFTLDKQLLLYFATASSLYEERIEIQKANLFKSQMPLAPPKDAPTAAQLLPLPLHEMASADDVVGVRPDRTKSDCAERLPDSIDQQSSESGLSGSSESGKMDKEDNRSNINVVPTSDDEERTDRLDQGNVSVHSDDNDVVDDDDFNEEDPNAGDEFSESDHDDDSESSHEESDNDEDENDDGELEDDQIVDDDEDEELQRALTLSLVPAVGANSSDDDACSRHSEDFHSGGDADSKVSEAITEAAVKREETLTTDVPASAKATTAVPPTPGEARETTLPSLPTPPPLSTFPGHGYSSQVHHGSDEAEKMCSDRNASPVFEPSALSSFGKLPTSHVLVHLFLAIQGMMQDHCSSSEGCVANLNVIGDEHENSKFLPDSTTALLLIASLHLLSRLRDSALKMLTDCISSSDEEVNNSINCRDVGGVQIAHTSVLDSDEGDDPLVEKDNPAGVEAAIYSALEVDSQKDNLESLENKGLKRKAAAAVQIACLRSETKQKLVQTWTNRAAFYSSCCILNLKCLRLMTGKSMEHAGEASILRKNPEKDVDEVPNPTSVLFPIPTKTRLSLLKLLSSFYSSSASMSFQSLKLSMIDFHKQYDKIMLPVDLLQDHLLVAALCNESLCLWGYALPLLYPDHQARVELLFNMLQSSPSTESYSGYNIARQTSGITSCSWRDHELQSWKIDIVCKRLRVSDMLDCFVAAPIMVSIDTKVKFDQSYDESNLRPKTKPPNGGKKILRLISLLSKTILGQCVGGGNKKSNNLTKFYLALCQRVTSFLILWNNLSISSIDANDHNISGGELGVSAGSAGGIGSYWSDIGSLQLNANPESFHFDSTKCADSISVSSSSSASPPITANQRAAKVWGTVLSATCFPPKSGVHRWAVRLDKCERGHVFVGIATSRTNLKTYVGGDSNGWGLIGTQALWHDRSKVRGDYGAAFRTGAVVVITLDTNAGTLSFGLWKEGSSAPDATHEPLLTQPRIGSTRLIPLQGQAGGGPYIEDWGIAFEGLPLDVKLYPGKEVHLTFLYQ